jgi:hypothetical protein
MYGEENAPKTRDMAKIRCNNYETKEVENFRYLGSKLVKISYYL